MAGRRLWRAMLASRSAAAHARSSSNSTSWLAFLSGAAWAPPSQAASSHSATPAASQQEAAAGRQEQHTVCTITGLLLSSSNVPQQTSPSSPWAAPTWCSRTLSTSSVPGQHQPQQHQQAPTLEPPPSGTWASPPANAAPPVVPQGFSINPHLLDSRSTAPLMSVQFPSSGDDQFGVQKNWFTSLYKQLNYMAKTGAVPGLKGRQRVVFEQVEHDFEALYNKYIRGQPLDDVSRRALLMCCLSVATYRALYDEVNDTRLVRDVIRTNLGSVMLSLLLPIHRFKLWLISWLLREDMYNEAAKMLPVLRADMGELCQVEMRQQAAPPADETVMVVHKCKYHELLTQEDTPFLLTEFCCHHALTWLHEFRRHDVVVSMDQCKAWDDSCCQLRIARAGGTAQGQQQQQQQQEGGAPPTPPPA